MGNKQAAPAPHGDAGRPSISPMSSELQQRVARGAEANSESICRQDCLAGSVCCRLVSCRPVVLATFHCNSLLTQCVWSCVGRAEPARLPYFAVSKGKRWKTPIPPPQRSRPPISTGHIRTGMILLWWKCGTSSIARLGRRTKRKTRMAWALLWMTTPPLVRISLPSHGCKTSILCRKLRVSPSAKLPYRRLLECDGCVAPRARKPLRIVLAPRREARRSNHQRVQGSVRCGLCAGHDKGVFVSVCESVRVMVAVRNHGLAFWRSERCRENRSRTWNESSRASPRSAP